MCNDERFPCICMTHVHKPAALLCLPISNSVYCVSPYEATISEGCFSVALRRPMRRVRLIIDFFSTPRYRGVIIGRAH